MRRKIFVVVAAVCISMMTTALGTAQTTKVKFAPIPAGEFRIDTAHSVLAFAIKHNEIALVRGRFRDFSGKINYDDKDITKSSVEVTAKIESINTGVDRRDAHLRTADFFDAPTYPEMTFKSTRVETKGNNQYVLHG